MSRLPNLAVGDLLIVLIALFTAAYHLGVFALWRSGTQRLWAAVVALGSAVFAGSNVALYSTHSPDLAPTYQRLGMAGGVVLCHAMIPLFGALAPPDRRHRRLEAASLVLAVAWTVIMVATPWVFADAVEFIHLDWHDAPYPQTLPGPLNTLSFLYLLGVSVAPPLGVLGTWRARSNRERTLAIVTLAWVVLGAYDAVVGMGWIPPGPAFFLEYGLLGFAVFLFADAVREHSLLLRRAEEARSAALAAFDLLARGSPDPILLLREGVVIFANDAAAALVGHTHGEALVGMRVDTLVHPEDLRLLEPESEQNLREPNDPPHPLLRLRRTDGGEGLAEVSVGRVVVDGLPARLVIARDVREEQALRHKALTLDRMVAMGTLAAGVAHEINNPLAYVRSSVEMMGETLEALLAGQDPRPLLEECAPLLDDARHGIERIRQIVQHLRQAARSDANGAARAELQDVGEVLAVALRLTRTAVEERATLETSIEATPPVLATPGHLSQVFVNLLQNAAEAIPPGHPTEHSVEVRAFQADGVVVVEVEDSGPGIPEGDLPQIFDPFFTTKPAGTGSGLGLFVCHHLVHAAGGTIEVRSPEGRGACFVVRLPAAHLAGA